MKAWTTAAVNGRCSYDGTHAWKAGARVFRLESPLWNHPRDYCPVCAVALHKAPPDTGELLEVEDAPTTHARPLKRLADRVRAEFDARMRAAGKDGD